MKLDQDAQIVPTMEDIERWRFHVEVLTKEIEALRQENEKLRSLAIRSLDQSVALLDRIAHIDGSGSAS